MTKRRVGVAVGVIVLGVAAAVAYVVWPRGTSPVTRDEALADFRDRTEQAASSPSGASGAPRSVAPGVYTYRTTGFEEVKLGVLPAEHRTYPDSTPMVIVVGDAGCFTATLNLLDQHTEDTTYCTDADGSVRLAGHTKHQRVGILNPVADMTCDPAVITTPRRRTTDLRCTLELDGGPAAVTAMLSGTSTTQSDSVTVGDEQFDATQVSIDYEVSGDLSGTWSERLWLASGTRLPLRIERALHIEGLATFTEESELSLADAKPAR